MSIRIRSLGAALALSSRHRPGRIGRRRRRMYRCPGNDYNNTITASEAEKLRCKKIENASVTVIQFGEPAAPSAASAAPPARPAAAIADADVAGRLGCAARARQRRAPPASKAA